MLLFFGPLDILQYPLNTISFFCVLFFEFLEFPLFDSRVDDWLLGVLVVCGPCSLEDTRTGPGKTTPLDRTTARANVGETQDVSQKVANGA